MGIVSFWKISNFFHDDWSEFWEIFFYFIMDSSYSLFHGKHDFTITERKYFEMLKIFLLEMIEIFVFDCVFWHERTVKIMIKWFWDLLNHLWNISGHKWIEEQLNEWLDTAWYTWHATCTDSWDNNLGKDLAVFSMQEEFSQLSLLLKYLVE